MYPTKRGSSMNIKILSLVSAIAWCVTMNASQDTSKALVTIDGRPFITEQQFNQEFDLILAWQPQVKELLPIVTDMKDQFLEGILNRKIVDKYIADNNLDSSAAYKKEFYEAMSPIKADTKMGPQEQAQAMNSIRSALNIKYFSEQFPATITDAEVQAYYDDQAYYYEQIQDQPLEKIKNELKGHLEDKNRRDKMAAEIERLKKEYKIVVVK